MRCICCGKVAIRRVHGFWVHKTCYEEVKYRLMLAKHALPKIGYELLFNSHRLFEAALVAFSSGNQKVIASIRRDVRKKSWKVLESRYGKPSWLAKDP